MSDKTNEVDVNMELLFYKATCLEVSKPQELAILVETGLVNIWKKNFPV